MEDTIDYGAVFGVDEGGNEQEVAEPAAEVEAPRGENEREVAEPAQEDVTNGESAGEDPGAAASSEETTAQAPEERARYAAARRKAEAERDAAIRRAKEDARAEAQRTIDEAFRNSGLTNPYTKRPITTKAEYDEYKERSEAEQKARVLKKSGMSDAEWDAFVETLPEVRAAKEAQRAAETAARQAREQQARRMFDEQLREISTLDPAIREAGDLRKLDTYPRFMELVKKGNSLTDAYKLANFDRLSRASAAAGEQAAKNAAQGKRHLSQTVSRGTGAAPVPADVREEYLALNPTATDEEIRRHYNAYRAYLKQ